MGKYPQPILREPRMSEQQNTVHNLVIHKLIKDPHGPARIELRDAPMTVTPSAQRLIDHLGKLYTERFGKGYGKFEDDEDNFPMSRFVRQHVIEQSIDFNTLSQLMMQHLQVRAEQEELASGGYVLIARVDTGTADCLFVAIVTEVVGTAITEGLDIVDTIHLDLTHLRVAGRIDLTGWQNQAERYISFVKGRGDVAHYFKLFLGCNDLVIALKETQKLVLGLTQFAEQRQLQPEARDELFERAHGYLDELGDNREPVSLDVMATRIWPQAPEQIRETMNSEEVEVSGGFVPDRRAIKPLMRFKVAAPQWRLEFDRASLRSGAVVYDRKNDTLVLFNIPENIRKELLAE